MRGIGAGFAVAAGLAMAAPAAATELWLAPGKSVTIFDAADPAVRLVITAPANAPLDLAPLLDLKADESVQSIATRVQLRSASTISIGADGALSLNQGAAPARSAAHMPRAGVLGTDAGQC